MLEPSCGLHLAGRKIHVIPSAVHKSPVSGRRARTGNPVPVIALLKPATLLHRTRGMEEVLFISDYLPAGLHDASRGIKVIPAATNMLPALGIAAVNLLEFPGSVRLELPSALVQTIRLGNALRICHTKFLEKVVILQLDVVFRIGDERVLDDDAGDAHLPSVRNHAVIIPQTSVGILAVILGIPDLDAAVLQTQSREFIEDVLTQLLSGLMRRLVIAATIGIIDFGSISAGALG